MIQKVDARRSPDLFALPQNSINCVDWRIEFGCFSNFPLHQLRKGRQALISFAFWYRSSMEFCCAVPLLGRLLKRWPFRLISLIRSTFCRICIIVPSVFSSLLCSLSRGNNFLIT
ncbi:uncharacterized protein LOC112508454 isoform X2 [Cynara cardunculus var. scolymus]|uniref:uncharacterized protein LOC112508454 isoform X2 n=1 Tax=Cynara cardunculus var. scolymus TaxID=59895 RepID=UPI000D627CD8|nr:uncharacterized protein LOC112508454 isoform X2 [Cynara cardunculus var. scolymus]